MAVNTGVVNCPDEQGELTYTECKLDCFRRRNFYRHELRPLVTGKGCKSVEPTCKEILAQLKAAKIQLMTGNATKTIEIDGKSFTNHAGSLACLKDEIYAYECRCGMYAGQPQSSGCSCGGESICIKNVSCGCSCGGCGCNQFGGGWNLTQ